MDMRISIMLDMHEVGSELDNADDMAELLEAVAKNIPRDDSGWVEDVALALATSESGKWFVKLLAEKLS